MHTPQIIVELLREIKDTIVSGNGVCNEKLYSTLHQIHDKYDLLIKNGTTAEQLPTHNHYHIAGLFFAISMAAILRSMYRMYRSNQMAAPQQPTETKSTCFGTQVATEDDDHMEKKTM